MSLFKSIVGKRNINLPGLSNRNIRYNPLKKIKTFLTRKKLDYSLLNSLGKGKWLIEFVFFNEKTISITSTKPEEFLLDLLNKLIKNKKTYFKLDSEFNFWDNKKSETQRKIILDLNEIKDIEYKLEKVDEEINALSISSKGFVSANNLIKELKKILNNKKSKIIFYNIKLKFRTNDDLIGEIDLENNNLDITINIDKYKIREILSNILKIVVKEDEVNYFIYYVDIKKIGGNWKTGKRRGYLIQEYGNEKKNWIKKYEF